MLVVLAVLRPLPAHADSDPIVPVSGTTTLKSYGQTSSGIVAQYYWEIDGLLGYEADNENNNTHGWSVTYTGSKTSGSFSITPPATTPTAGHYSVVYPEKLSGSGDLQVAVGPSTGFWIKPVRPVPHQGAPFAWKGGSGGVNLGNGNMLTSVPLVGWTAPGGLPVAFTGQWTYHYDGINRLTSLDTPDGTAGFTYDYGNRLTRQDNGNGTYSLFGFGAAGQVVHTQHFQSGGRPNPTKRSSP